MKKICVNKTDNLWQLKVLFPGIRLALSGVPAYGRVVYMNFPMTCSKKTELVLEQSLAGYNLESHLGLLGFLRECGYMSPAKLDRFEAAGRPREVDSKGHEVVSEGRFYEDADVLQMYYFCSTLRVSNRVYLEDDEDAEYILDLLESPLYARILEADKVGPRVLLRRILGFMDSFYSKDVQFRARSHGRVSGFDRMQKITAMFNRRAFKDFKLSDDAVEDVYVFLSLFGEAA